MDIYTDRNIDRKDEYDSWIEQTGELLEAAPSLEAVVTAFVGMLAWSRHKAHEVVSEQRGESRCNCERVWGSLFSGKLAAAAAGNGSPLGVEELQKIIADMGIAMVMAAPDEVITSMEQEIGYASPAALIRGATHAFQGVEDDTEFQVQLMSTRNDVQMRASFLDAMQSFGIDQDELGWGDTP